MIGLVLSFSLELNINQSYLFSLPANENGLKRIEMDLDFQKYWFTNDKMNPECIFIHLYELHKAYISMLFNLKIM